MDELQTLMGEAYHEGITTEEVANFFKGKKFADDEATLASIRSEGAKGGEFTVGGNLKVASFENKVKELYGIEVQVANPDDTKLADNGITLVAAGKA